MRKPQGYSLLVDPVKGTRERDTFTCAHCQHVTEVKPMSDPTEVGGLCKQCMGLICPRCVTKRSCMPWEKQMEVMEARQRMVDAARMF